MNNTIAITTLLGDNMSMFKACFAAPKWLKKREHKHLNRKIIHTNTCSTNNEMKEF